jgi:hypothetical protein
MNGEDRPRAASTQRAMQVTTRRGPIVPASDCVVEAHLVVRGLRGMFFAETCEVHGNQVTAVGRLRRKVGINYQQDQWSDVQRRAWPRGSVEIRWQPGYGDEAAA